MSSLSAWSRGPSFPASRARRCLLRSFRLPRLSCVDGGDWGNGGGTKILCHLSAKAARMGMGVVYGLRYERVARSLVTAATEG
eukprot:scaffold62393_cov31-Tisochrysis_lutea.AAC.2